MNIPRNPFTPLFGIVPPVMAGRDDLIETMDEAFAAGTGNPDLVTLLVGARGTGKTALLTRICDVARQGGWITASTSTSPDMLEDILEQASTAAAEFTRPETRRRLTSVTIGPLSIDWEYKDPKFGNWRTRMTRLIEQLNDQGIGLLITVDEALGSSKELVQLVTVLQHFITEGRTVGLVMAGLPHNVSSLVNGETTSFLRRARYRHLGSISDADVRSAFRLTVKEGGRTLSEEALTACVEAIEGFPFMMQLVGYRAWQAAGNEGTIDVEAAQAGIVDARQDIREQILAATYHALSTKDRAFVRAMAEDERESRMVNIAKRLDKSTGYTSTYKHRMLEQGVIREAGKGHVAFDIPGFRNYVLEQDEEQSCPRHLSAS